MKKLYKRCEKCNGTGKIKLRSPYHLTPDVKRMLAIMKRNNLTQLDLAKTLEISQGTVNGWLHKKTNLQGKIKPIYFEVLKAKKIK